MRMITTTLLWTWCSSIISGVSAHTADKQLTAIWEGDGTCAYYFKKPGKRSSLAETCVRYCENNGGHGFSQCDLSPVKDIDFEHGFDKSIIQEDDAGDVYVPSRCKCENKDVEELSAEIFDILAKGLEKLDNLLCAVMLEAFKTIIEVGIEFVPGGAVLNGAKAAVQGAKSFAENGLEAADFFGDWVSIIFQSEDLLLMHISQVGNACGVPDWNLDLWGGLLGAPDSYGTSIGCKRKNKSACKKPDSKPDPTEMPDGPPVSTAKDKTEPTSTKEESKPTTTKYTEPKPTSTKTGDSSTTTSSSSGCPSATDTKSPATCQSASPCEYQGSDIGEDYSEEDTDEADAGEEISLLRRSGHRSPRRVLLERRKNKKNTDEDPDKKKDDKGRKVGNPCTATSKDNPDKEIKDFKLRSGKYPRNGELKDATLYGWLKHDDKCDYAWQSGKPQVPKPKGYDSEHVLEWQVVTDFFAKMNQKSGTKYTHPDPAKAKEKVDFCTYWIKSWSLEAGQEFTLDNSPKRDPWGHIAAAYPSKDINKEEFVRLQRNINTPTKANVSLQLYFLADIPSLTISIVLKLFNDGSAMIFDQNKMKTWLPDKDGRYEVLIRLRRVLGAQKYLNEPDIIKIFKNQKTRMGDILDKLDTAMNTHPRKIKDDTTGAVTTTYNVWEKQDLLAEWNAHMDEKWKQATAKQKKVMDTYLQKLDDAHCKKTDDKDGKDGTDSKDSKDNNGNGKDSNDGKTGKGGKGGKGGKDDKDDEDPDKVFCDRLTTLKEEYQKESALSKAPWDDATDAKSPTITGPESIIDSARRQGDALADMVGAVLEGPGTGA
ncbi:MAG: hypothetical protein Q9160_007777 [Pyrenula sp. 1 TL-2023]